MSVRPISKVPNIGALERHYEQSVPSAWRDAQEALAGREGVEAAEAQRDAAASQAIADKYPSLKDGA